MKTLHEMWAQLEHHPDVTGLIEYGSRSISAPTDVNESLTGDYDLIVVLTTNPSPVSSLHFDVGNMPVDMSLISLEALRQCTANASFEGQVIATGRVRYDPTGEVKREQIRIAAEATTRQIEPWSPHDIAFMRHGHRHLLDKVVGRLDSDPILCQILLNTNVYWLLENYFRLRYLPFQGIKTALDHIRKENPKFHKLLDQFYATTALGEKVQLTIEMTALALEPVGGMWRRGEILAFGDPSGLDLPQQGESVYTYLFDTM